MTPSTFVTPYRVEHGRKFRLAAFDPGDTGGLDLKEKEAREGLREGVKRLAALQDKLYAHNRWAVLVIFQAMDAAGKDSAIEHVMSGVNPMGCQVFGFKAPSSEELEHDFMWRTTCRLPERGRIGIFNRSYYEEVLAVRVHREYLEAQRLPEGLVGEDIWRNRFEDITAFERYISRNGTKVLKLFLHLSREEQRRRFIKRLDEPEKNWKFSMADVHERKHWDEYMDAYEDMIRNTSTPAAPWHVIPADNKWFTHLAVAATVIEAMEGLGLSYPTVEEAKKAELKAARAALDAE